MRPRLLASFAAIALSAVTALGMAPSPAAAADRGGELIGLTASNQLVRFGPTTPGTAAVPVAVTGLQDGETLLGIDVRPATGQLYGLGSTSRLYVIDAASGVATGFAPFSPTLTGTTFGFDFNPTVDRIRVISDSGQNLRLNPITGLLATNDGALAYAPGDSGAGMTPATTAAAYTNSTASATTTALFDIDTDRDVLVLQSPPNNGTLNTVGALGVNATAANGFDVAPGGSAYAALITGGITNLATINLTTGAATIVGPIGNGLTALRGLTVVPVVDHGYWLMSATGEEFAFGDAPALGSLPGSLVRPIVGTVATPSGNGRWSVASDGGVFAQGDAGFFGSTGNIVLNKPIVGMAPTPSGKGYYLVASDGGIFAFGDAVFRGSTGNIVLNKPVVGMAVHPAGTGYWLVASDGGVFSFGVPFFGSTGNIVLNKPVVGMAATVRGAGYWMVASDGGIFAFGDATFKGSTGNIALAKPIVGMVRTSRGSGYWMVASDGGVFSFGGAPFLGSANRPDGSAPIAGMTAL